MFETLKDLVPKFKI